MQKDRPTSMCVVHGAHARYLHEIVGEFLNSTRHRGPKCIPPSCVDQAVHNYLYYTKRFGNRTSSFKYILIFTNISLFDSLSSRTKMFQAVQ